MFKVVKMIKDFFNTELISILPGKNYSISKNGRITVDLETFLKSENFEKQLILFNKIGKKDY